MQLAWAESRLNEGLIRKRRAILGPDDGDDKTVTILNRLVTWVCNDASELHVYQPRGCATGGERASTVRGRTE